MRCRSSICESIGCDHQKLYVVKELHSLRMRLSIKFSLAVARMFEHCSKGISLHTALIPSLIHQVLEPITVPLNLCELFFHWALTQQIPSKLDRIVSMIDRTRNDITNIWLANTLEHSLWNHINLDSSSCRLWPADSIFVSVRPLYTTLAIQIQARNGWR